MQPELAHSLIGADGMGVGQAVSAKVCDNARGFSDFVTMDKEFTEPKRGRELQLTAFK
jgi:hypothetical protein